MNLSWFADIAGLISFALSLPMYWAVVSEKGRTLMFGKKWIPFSLFTVAITVAAFHLLFLLGFIGHRSPTPNARLFFETEEMAPIRGYHYLNEEVLLDGHEFINCTFDNVTFIYNGLAPFNLIGPVPTGTFRFRTKSKQISHLLTFLKSLNQLKSDAVVFPDPEYSQIH